MEKERRIKILSLVALVVAVLCLTVAFAALSTTLTINGTAKVDAATWDVHFENPTCEDAGMEENDECTSHFKEGFSYLEEGAGKVNKNPTIDVTTISGIDATITKPNDTVRYNFMMVNNGTINAKIDSISISKLCESTSSPVESCDWDGNGTVSEDDIQKVHDNISFVVSTAGEQGPEPIKPGAILKVGERKFVIVHILYKKAIYENNNLNEEEATELPKRDLTFSDLNVTINFVQAD